MPACHVSTQPRPIRKDKGLLHVPVTGGLGEAAWAAGSAVAGREADRDAVKAHRSQDGVRSDVEFASDVRGAARLSRS